MLNLTPHEITIINPDGVGCTIPPSGTVARVVSTEETISTFHKVPVIRRVWGAVEGLPNDDTTICLVSSLVLEHCKGRANVFAPDTGKTAIRDQHGQVVAVTRLIAA